MDSMAHGTIFIAGIYGVGKSTLCRKLTLKTGISSFSAGDLISKSNGEIYGANKQVKDKNANQNVLIATVAELLAEHESILLAGHFCILKRDGTVDILPDFVYDKLHLAGIILLEAPIPSIYEHLNSRDNVKYPTSILSEMKKTENDIANKIALKLSVPMYVHEMHYDESDVEKCIDFIKELENV